MDRDRLTQWLTSKHRTWRWSDGSGKHYEGVETSQSGLRWFRWSHEFDVSGVHSEIEQTFKDYRENGAARPVPPPLEGELAQWVRDNAGDTRPSDD